LSGRLGHGRAPRLGGMHAQPVPDRWLRDADRAGTGHSVQGSGHARPAVGAHLGRKLREEYGQAETRARSRIQVTGRRGRGVTMKRRTTAVVRTLAVLASVSAMCLAAGSAGAHHSYA